MAKNKKIRVDMRKNRSKPPRQRDWTRGFQEHGYSEEATASNERVRAKGDLSRKRTIVQDETAAAAGAAPGVDARGFMPGRVLRIHGLFSIVETEQGQQYRCTVRGVLRTVATEERSAVTTGDRVWFRPTLNDEGQIERVEPRHGILTRASRGREHVLVANVDQLVVVVSLVEPALKPHLIDRYRRRGGARPGGMLEKADLGSGAYHDHRHTTRRADDSDEHTGGGTALREVLRGRQTAISNKRRPS